MATTEIFKAKPIPQAREQRKFSITESHNFWLVSRAKEKEITTSEALEQLIDFGSAAEQGILFAPSKAEVLALTEWASSLGQSPEVLFTEALKTHKAYLDKASKKASKKFEKGKQDAEASL
ncbi:hypothetical protein [Geothrix sp. PMB-07]|uniref:hypothetical protein n=1 Tax=Geothrix sp. PMB-07 TaxID=3068640 RepID=UPI0027429425|nr:hypothetical protein [Geothrix sp. PMB-07]WLT30658.1 hypothetical protein Q9293_13130 [Geothrix sp. PMB-07]